MKVVYGILGDLAQFFGVGRSLSQRRDQTRRPMQQFVSVHHRVTSKC